MSGTYGRNFEFRVPPEAQNRLGRYVSPVDPTVKIPIGAPIEVDTATAAGALGLQPVKLATAGGDGAPGNGLHGILVYEFGPAAFAGHDPFLTTFSDLDVAPPGRAVQMVSSREVKVVLRNTLNRTFLTARAYPGREMVAGFGATPALAVGDFLAPGVGTDTAGYWSAVTDEALAWLVITSVDTVRAEVEARMLF